MPENSLASEVNARSVTRVGAGETARAERIVHSLDGIGQAVEPERLHRLTAALWNAAQGLVPDTQPTELLGLDAGGILPTVGVSNASGLPFRVAWKLDLELEPQIRFSEPHARRTDVFVYGNVRNARILIVDDEVTTGSTLVNLVSALRSHGADVYGVAVLVEDRDGRARAALAKRGVPLCSLATI